MANDSNIVEFILDLTQPEKAAIAMANILADLQQELGRTDKSLTSAQKSLAQFGTRSESAIKAVANLTKAQANLVKAESDQAAAASRVAQAEQLANGSTDRRTKAVRELTQAQASLATATSNTTKASAALAKAQATANSFVSKPTAPISTGSPGAGAGSRPGGQSLLSTGAALFGVGFALQSVSTGLLALDKASFTTAIEFQRDFANVTRTVNDLSDSALQNLRKQLINLSTDIPVAFGDLTQIAALGGQLDIPGTGIASFTKVVAELTATTNLSAEAAGTALGRFQLLFNLNPNGQDFEKLASAILAVGVNSVATETQIVGISTQIASMGHFAGLSADQVVGLAGALASVGAAPELSRGTITRVFSLISKAVANGSANLEQFARISGLTSQQFSESFKTPGAFAGTFTKFIEGLNQIQNSGGNVVQVLNDLGISSVRDVPLVERLAQANDLVRKNFATAATAYAVGTELNKQYGIVAETTAAKITKLVNTFQKFFDQVGSNATGPIADLVDALGGAVSGISDLLNSAEGSRLATFTIILSGVVGVILSVLASLTLATASVFFFQSALHGLIPTLGLNSITLAKTTEGAYAFSIAQDTAAASTVRLTTVAKGLGKALGIVGLVAAAITFGPDILKGAIELGSTITSVNKTVKDLAKTVEKSFTDKQFSLIGGSVSGAQLVGNGDIGTQFNRGAGALGAASPDIFNKIARLDEKLKEMVSKGNLSGAIDQLAELKASFLSGGGDIKGFNVAFGDTIGALKDQAAATGVSVDSLAALQAQADATAAANQNLADSLGLDSVDALAQYQKGVDGAVSAVLDLGKALDAATKSGIVDINKFNEITAAQIKAVSNIQNNLLKLAASGVGTDVIDQFNQLIAANPSSGSQLLQQTVDSLKGAGATTIALLSQVAQQAGAASAGGFSQGFIDEQSLVTQAFAQVGEAGATALLNALATGDPAKIAAVIAQYNLKFSTNPIILPVTTNTALATAQLNAWISKYASQGVNVKVNPFFNSPTKKASGGYISGPGTGTSDSIPARLSNGEYVVRASSVRKYGAGFMDSLNRGAARFSAGGHVGHYANGGPVATSSSMQTVRLDAYSLKVLARAGVVLQVDGRVLADVSSNADRKSNNRGRG